MASLGHFIICILLSLKQERDVTFPSKGNDALLSLGGADCVLVGVEWRLPVWCVISSENLKFIILLDHCIFCAINTLRINVLV